MADLIDADTLRRWCAAASRELRRLAGEIDALNVFPVADADTGTNMSLTMSAAAAAAGRAGAGSAGLAATAATMSQAALMAARGNSGLILSQVLAGFAESLFGRSAADAADLSRCLRRGSELAYAAVAEPAEGTILSVARAAAAAAGETAAAAAGRPDAISQVAFAASRAAADELAGTPLRLPVLARAGVVDAGGRGLLAVLSALACAVTGQLPQFPAAAVIVSDGDARVAVREAGRARYRHEVTYLLSAAPGALPALRRRLASLGDSVVIAGTGRLWRVHAHVNDTGAAVAAGRHAGEVQRVTCSRLVDGGTRQGTQAGPPAVSRRAASATTGPASPGPRAPASPSPSRPLSQAQE